MQLGSIALAAAFTAALLFAEHIAMWNQPWRADAPWNYVIGVLTLAAGWLVWGLIATGPIDPLDAAISIALVSFGGGAVIVLCYAVRARLDQGRKKQRDRCPGRETDAGHY
jgi:membrane associated rhomboid family serine protease